ncbi:MAG: hypothetical protein WKF92_06470 [Pyrinomonadaceae bacterium]
MKQFTCLCVFLSIFVLAAVHGSAQITGLDDRTSEEQAIEEEWIRVKAAGRFTRLG